MSTGFSKQPSRLGLLRGLAPHLPSALYHAFLHLLSLSPTSPYWDLKSVLIVSIIRSYLHKRSLASPPPTVESSQKSAMGQQEVPLQVLMAPVSYSCAPPEALELERTFSHVIGGDVPEVGLNTVTAEWIGARPEDSILANLSPGETYKSILDTLPRGENSPVILYFHGGAYYLCDPQTHRVPCRRLAKTSESRLLSVRYRLAPQHPFPAALLDCFVSYIYLLYPPPGAFHRPVPASRIVFAGDSAGGGLAFSLLQIIQALDSAGKAISWGGEQRNIPLPAGVAGLSPYVEATRCFSGLTEWKNGSEDICAATTDYLPSPESVVKAAYAPSEAWNSKIRRNRKQSLLYAADSLLTNPFVSPIIAASWPKEVAYWISVGDECLRDSNRVFGERLVESCGDQLRLRYEHYDSMPHVFQCIVPHHKAAERAWQSLAGFVRVVTATETNNGYEWGSRKVHPTTLEETQYELGIEGVNAQKLGEMMRVAVDAVKIMVEEMDERLEAENAATAASKLQIDS